MEWMYRNERGGEKGTGEILNEDGGKRRWMKNILKRRERIGRWGIETKMLFFGLLKRY
jgi:hypothetical protein